MNKLVSIGKILNFHGIKGEVKMGFTAGNESLIKNLKQVYIFDGDKKVAYDVQSVRFHKNFAIVKFSQINSVNEVIKIKGLLVHITDDILKANLERDEFLMVCDLAGVNSDYMDFLLQEIYDNKEKIANFEKVRFAKFLKVFFKKLEVKW